MNENDANELVEFGKRVEEIRNMRGMTLQALADKSGYTSRSSIKKIEKGEVNVPTQKVKAIADALGVSPLVLMGREEIPVLEPYYINEETAAIAQEIYEGKDLRALFDVVRDISPEDMAAVYSVALALKRKERGES